MCGLGRSEFRQRCLSGQCSVGSQGAGMGRWVGAMMRSLQQVGVQGGQGRSCAGRQWNTWNKALRIPHEAQWTSEGCVWGWSAQINELSFVPTQLEKTSWGLEPGRAGRYVEASGLAGELGARPVPLRPGGLLLVDSSLTLLSSCSPSTMDTGWLGSATQSQGESLATCLVSRLHCPGVEVSYCFLSGRGRGRGLALRVSLGRCLCPGQVCQGSRGPNESCLGQGWGMPLTGGGDSEG